MTSPLVECPLCFKNFSNDFIETHAQKCKGKKNAHSDDPNDNHFPALKKAKTTSSQKTVANFLSPKAAKISPDAKKSLRDKNNQENFGKSPPAFPNIFRKKELKANSSSSAQESPTPLAERSRPTTVNDYVGQKQIFSKNSVLNDLLRNNVISSMIFWGPPGCGKTSLANVIAVQAKTNVDRPLRFVKLSATSSGKADVQAAVATAKNEWKMFKRRTILFIDEIHRFNKLQQDTFLPHVENGTIILIGATTENPSFSLNSALLSRCRVVVLEKLSSSEVQDILMRALKKFEGGIKIISSDMDQYTESSVGESKEERGTALLGESSSVDKDETPDSSPDCEILDPVPCQTPRSCISITEEAIYALANLCDGDARIALNGLQMSIDAARAVTEKSSDASYCIDLQCIKRCFQRSHVLYDRKGDQHYDIISAFHKSIRGCDDNAALYWLARMIEGGEDPRYIARRLIRIASEDIGLADSNALNLAVSTHQACEFVGKPECDVILSQCTVYLARAPKSVEVYFAYLKAKECIQNHEGALPGVPLHLRNAPTKLMKNLGYGKGYSYEPDENQTYLPDSLLHCNFFDK